MEPQHHSRSFEFRLFDEVLDEYRAPVAACGIGVEPEAQKDIYLLAPGKDAVNVKLSDGQLEVKVLEGREQGVEVWRKTLAAELPVSASAFLAGAAALLDVSFDVPSTAVLDAAEIVNLAALEPGLVVVEVDKRRRKHSVEGGHCEVVDFRAGDVTRRSFAIESRSREVVERLIRRFKLPRDINEGYPSYLLRHTR